MIIIMIQNTQIQRIDYNMIKNSLSAKFVENCTIEKTRRSARENQFAFYSIMR